MDDKCKHATSTGEGKPRFYCTDCDIRVCDACMDDDHSQHNFCTVAKAAEAKKQQLLQILGPGKGKQLQKLHEISDRIQKLKQSCSRRTEALTQVVNERASVLNLKIEEIRQQLIQELLEYQQKCEKPYTEAQIKIDQCISNISQYSSSLEDIMKENDEILKIQKTIEYEINSIPKPDKLPLFEPLKFEMLDSENVEMKSVFGKVVKLNTENKICEEVSQGIGNIDEENVNCLNKDNGETVSCVVTDTNGNSVEPEEIDDVITNETHDIGNESTVDGEPENCSEKCCQNLEDACCKPEVPKEDSTDIPTIEDFTCQQNIKLFDPPLAFTIKDKASVNKILPYSPSSLFTLSSFNVRFINMKQVHSSEELVDGEIVLQNVEDVTMTQAGHLLYIEQNESNIRRLIPPDKFVNFASFPGMNLEALDATKQDRVLVCVRNSVENKSTAIALLDMTGIKLRNIPLYMGNRFPYRIMENGNKDICIVDLAGRGISKGCIRILDTNGRYKATYAGVIGYKPSDTFQPRGFCYDEENRIIVTDFCNHAVHQLDPNGKYRKILLKQDDGLMHPLSVTLNRFGFLCVGCLYGKVLIRNYIEICD